MTVDAGAQAGYHSGWVQRRLDRGDVAADPVTAQAGTEEVSDVRSTPTLDLSTIILMR
jgi:hypothetical protein